MSSPDRKVVASGVYDVLEAADREFRRRRRGVFRKVDRIKQQPGWIPWWERRPASSSNPQRKRAREERSMSGKTLYRREWSTVNARFSPLPGAMPEAVQHHTAGASPGDDLIGWLRALEAGEMSRGDGLIALAYHWMVISGGPHDGTKIECRPWGVQGGATLNHNSSSRAVCMSGNFENDHPTDNALDSTAEVWADAMRGGWVSRAAVIQPHQLYFPTACCGRNLVAALPDLRGRTSQKLSGVPVPPPKPVTEEPMWLASPHTPIAGFPSGPVAGWHSGAPNDVPLLLGASIKGDVPAVKDWVPGMPRVWHVPFAAGHIGVGIYYYGVSPTHPLGTGLVAIDDHNETHIGLWS
jgi:hypothetical protein